MRKMITLNNGFQLPVLGYGTYRIKEPEIIKPLIEKALCTGYRLFDTAAVYQNEEYIGQVLQDKIRQGELKRENVFITSKLAPSHQGIGKCRSAILTSLKRLQVDYLDLYLIHWPGASGKHPDDPQHRVLRKESWQEMESLYREGKLKAIGVSNYLVPHLDEMLKYCTVLPSVLQVEYHPHLVQQQLLQYCTDHRIHVQAYSSLGAASGCEKLLSEPILLEIARKYSKTPAQVLLRWATQHGLSVIPKTTQPKRLEENADIFDFDLLYEDMNNLNSLDKQTHYCWDPSSIL